MTGLNFFLGEDIDMLRDTVQSFAAKEIAPRAAAIDLAGRIRRAHLNCSIALRATREA